MVALREDQDLKVLYNKRLSNRRNYSLDRALEDLLLLKVISPDEFEKLGKFKAARNTCLHNDAEDEEVVRLYKEYHPVVEELLEQITKI